MAATTLAQFRTRVRQRADMENSNFVSDSELNGYVNKSISELYDLLVSSNSEYFLSSSSSTVAFGGSTITLPTDFYKLRGVDFYLGGRCHVKYRLQGSTIKLIPEDNVDGQYRVWYTPLPTELSSDSDSFEGINGWEEYVVVDAAIKCLQKEESSTTDLEKAKAQLGKRVADMAAKRDSAKPKQITNVNAPFRYSSYSRLRR
jgi:hypothetical protein